MISPNAARVVSVIVSHKRSRTWVADAAHNPAAAARDVFPWREPRPGAAYHLGCALALWCDVHGARPHTNERAMEVAAENARHSNRSMTVQRGRGSRVVRKCSTPE